MFEAQKFPDGKPNKGRVQAYDGPIYIADAALYLMHKNPALGIKDPYELNEAQYAEVLKLLRAQKQLTHRYWHDVTVQMNDFKNEGVAASSAWGYQINALQAEKFPIEGVIPKEGATGWADSTMLHAEAKNPVCAYKVDGTFAETASCSLRWPNGSARYRWCRQPAATRRQAARIFASRMALPASARSSSGRRRQAKCATQGACVPYSRWTQDYIAIMGGR